MGMYNNHIFEKVSIHILNPGLWNVLKFLFSDKSPDELSSEDQWFPPEVLWLPLKEEDYPQTRWFFTPSGGRWANCYVGDEKIGCFGCPIIHEKENTFSLIVLTPGLVRVDVNDQYNEFTFASPAIC